MDRLRNNYYYPCPLDHGKRWFVLAALGHGLCAGKVKHDDPETILSEDLQGDEVPDLQLVSIVKSAHPWSMASLPLSSRSLTFQLQLVAVIRIISDGMALMCSQKAWRM